MPALDVQQQPIAPVVLAARSAPVHPSPSRDQLRLERMSDKEILWWGERFGIDTPYLAVPLGWGEWSPLYGFDAEDFDPAVVRELVPGSVG